MKILTNLMRRLRPKQFAPKRFMVLSVGALTLLAIVAAGLLVRHQSLAAVSRDCGEVSNGVHNSIANNPNSGGGCGAADPAEVITDIKNGNPDDQASIYSAFGLGAGDYTNFADHAETGTALQNGDIVDAEGNKVMTDAWSIGRVKFGYSTPFSIPGTFKSMHTDVLKSDMPVFILFDKTGSVQAAVLAPCGNPVNGNKVPSSGECKMLNMTPVAGKDNTFSFTTDVTTTGFAKVVKVDYFIDQHDGKGQVLFASEPNPATAVTHTFSVASTVTAKVTFSIPGKQTIVVTSPPCSKEVPVQNQAFQMCKALVATTLDEANRKFRFTANTSQSAGVTVQSANFTLDGSSTTNNVTDKDASGNIFKDYTFNDDNSHTVSAVVNFLVDGKTVQSKEECKATVTPTKKPTPPTPTPTPTPKPVTPVPPLPSTGPGDAAGIFAGASAVGTLGHHLLIRRRKR